MNQSNKIERQERILKELNTISQQDVIFPVELIKAANFFAKDKDDDAFIAVLVSKLNDYQGESNSHVFVRRVIYLMLRFAGRSKYETFDLVSVLSQGLDDKNPWVQYDAIWAVEALKVADNQIYEKIKILARDYDKVVDEKSINVESELRRKAFETLSIFND